MHRAKLKLYRLQALHSFEALLLPEKSGIKINWQKS